MTLDTYNLITLIRDDNLQIIFKKSLNLEENYGDS